MIEGDPYRRIGQLGQDALELRAEYNGATDAHEREMVRLQLCTVHVEHRRTQDQIEALDGLPDLWESLYGGVAGYLALFSGLRHTKRLQRPQAGCFPYPDRVDEAQRWVRAAAAPESVEQEPVQPVPHTRPLPVTQPAPAGTAAPAAQL